MKRRLVVIAEIVFARLMPGLLNVLVIMALGKILSSVEYGNFSISFASVAFVASLLVGPIEHSIVPSYSHYEKRGGARKFEAQLMGAIAFVATAILLLGAVAVATGVANGSWVALLLSSSLFRVVQPILRAKMQFWRYGMAALVQAAIVFVLCIGLLHGQETADVALYIYSIAYLVGAAVTWLMCGAPLPAVPSREVFSRPSTVGMSLTISSVAENALYLGSRYAILLFGSPSLLGIFSFSADLAQRTVGVAINIASFAIVPRAYGAAAEGNKRKFKSLLLRAAQISGVLSFCILLSMSLIEYILQLNIAFSEPFGFLMLASAALAIAVNRIKKLLIDPVVIISGRSWVIPLAYGVTAPVSFTFLAVSLHVGIESSLAVIYPLSYIAVFVLSFVIYRRILAKDK